MFDDLWSTISGWFSSDTGSQEPTTTPVDGGSATQIDYTPTTYGQAITELVNTAGPGEPGYGYKYYSDGTTVDPSGSYYFQGQKVYDPNDPTVAEKVGKAIESGQGGSTKSWLDTILGGASSGIKGLVTNSQGKTDYTKLATMAGGLLGGLASGQSWAQPKVTPTGYQGGIPRYTSVREVVPGTYDPNRRPGSRGQEYFTQQQYPTATDVATAKANAAEEAKAAEARNKARTAEYAAGGLAGLAGGTYLSGSTDGMADKIPATIAGKQPAKLSHGEFVVPADVVSHLGNGNSEAGADRLYGMMDKVRKARTGSTKQGKQINPNKYLPG
jgi:hypothetical protein